MEHVRGIKIQEAVSLWREIDPSVKNESYHALRSKISRAAEKGIIDTVWFSGYSHKLYKNTDVIKFAKSLMKSEPVANCNQTEQPTSDCSQLPKLTAEVFDRPDCPEWAKYAAIHANGIAFFYENEPSFGVGNLKGRWYVDDGEFCRVDTTLCFDPSDWQNSLIERPEKKTMPDWCKVGEWVYIPQIDEYFHIEKIESILLFNNENHYIDYTYCKQARLRPYNAEEMQGLIGKVLTSNSRSTPFSFLVVYAEGDGSFIESYRFKYTAEELKDHFTIYGKPCGALEHLENGEWVK